MQEHTILYSFRRCPYAMRARLALSLSQQQVELREIVLKNKPASMLKYSPKGTVPVLVLKDALADKTEVIDESLDIMCWAFKQADPEGYLCEALLHDMLDLIAENDGNFKFHLDRYKYADRYPEKSELEYRQQGELFLQKLEQRLAQHKYLFGERAYLADLAIFPFVRQFAHVNLNWFEQSPYQALKRWLDDYKRSELFLGIMKKYPAWKEGDDKTWLL